MSLLPSSIRDFLRQPYELTQEQIDFYQRNRFIKLKNMLNDETLQYYAEVITDKVNEMNKETRSLQERSTYGKAFLQLFNLWREDERIREFVFSPRFAKAAADLM
jgi:hypothetical protein